MILNLTQHAATPEQIAAGVVDLTGEDLLELKRALTFDTLPHVLTLYLRAQAVAEIAVKNGAVGCGKVMIGGAPFFMSALEVAMLERAVSPVYAFSVRDSADQPQPDGSVRKVAVFKHGGFINPTEY